MKTKKPFLRLVALAALSLITGNELVAQTNIGQACGCPLLSTRSVANITTVGTWTNLPTAAYGKELANSQTITLTCNTTWLLNEKLYIGDGSTLIIEPGAVIKGTTTTNTAAARALIIERGGKIMAQGNESCPIVFTAEADILDGSYGVTNEGQWGGVLVCGKATNNLKLSNNGPFVPGQSGKNAQADGLGVLEGFASSLPQDWYGVQISNTAGYTALSAAPASTTTYSSTPATTKQNLSGSTILKLTTSPASNASITVGMVVSGTGIVTGTTVSAISGAEVTLSAASNANMVGTYTFTPSSGSPVTGTAISGCLNSYEIMLDATPAYNVQGLVIANASIPTGTTILAISGQILTLTAALTADLTGTTTISGTYASAPTVGTSYANVAGSTATGPMQFANGTSGQLVNLNLPAPTGTPGTFDDNDNSGVLSYVSIRHSGANLLVGSEINGLTLASVGRNTKVDHIEIVSCNDDNIEIFGGTVNLKYCTTLFGNDDMIDYDQGWTGKAQFIFGMKANQFTTANGVAGSTLSGISPDNDHGFEMDSDDSQSYNLPRSTPVIYNATMIGNDKIVRSADNTSMAGICAKENAGGSIYNSLFANFRTGFNMKKSLGTASSHPNGGEAYHNWTMIGGTNTTSTGTGAVGTALTLSAANASIVPGMIVTGTGIAAGTTVSSINGTAVVLSVAATAPMSGTYAFNAATAAGIGNGTQILKVKCNTFVNNMTTGAPRYAATDAGSSSGTDLVTADQNQFTAIDKNIQITALDGFSPAFQITSTPTTNAVGTRNDYVPSPGINVQLGTGCSQAPNDGFFEQVSYRGAFKPSTSNANNWLSDWSYSQVLGASKGLIFCPTDINNDGTTNVNDFILLTGQWGAVCN